MVKKIFLTPILILICWVGFTQSENSKLIQQLLIENGIQHIQLSNNESPIFRFKEGEEQTETQEIIPGKNGIMVLLSGNSKVYQYNQTTGYLEKIDQTRYHGHNFGASNILYNDTIYSLGGYGFWQMNGGVRYYNKNSKEWDIIKAGKLVPFANGINSISFFDAKEAKLYVLYHYYNSEYLNPGPTKYPLELAIFDFKTKTWQENQLIVSEGIALDIKDISVVQKLSNGLLINTKTHERSILLNFAENLVYKLNSTVTTELIQLKNKHQNNLIYTKGQTLFLYDRAMDSLFSYQFKPSYFEKTNLAIYTIASGSSNKNTYYIVGLGVLVLIIVIIIVINRIRQTSRKKTHSTEIIKREIKDFIVSLDEIEKIVVKQILENARENQNTTTNQLNKLLGTEKKEFKIQNNIRSEVIMNINKKFKLFSNINDDLIERERAELDKRFMEYNINKLYLKKISSKMF